MRQLVRGRVAALGVATAATALALPTVAGAVTFPSPSGESTFETNEEGWTAVVDETNCVLIVLPNCDIEADWTNLQGNTPGSLESSYEVILAALGEIGDGSSVWTSPPFTYTGGLPSDVTFSFDRRADIAALLAAGGSSETQVTLVDTGDATEYEIFSPTTAPDNASDSFAFLSEEVPPNVIEPGRTYEIQISTTFSSSLASVLAAQEVQYDNVALEVTEDDGSGGNGGGGDGSGGGGGGSGGGAGGAGAGAGAGAGGQAAPPPPTQGAPVCNEVPERRTSRKGQIVYTKEALKIQQNIDSAVIRRVNAVNAWIDAGIVPTDLCAGVFGPGAFQSGMTFVGGAPHTATPPTPRPTRIVNNSTPGGITKSLGQLRINEKISRVLRARAEATRDRITSLTGGNLAPGATLANRPVWPGLTTTGPKPPPVNPPATELDVGPLPPAITLVENASTVRQQQQRSQGSIRVANEALDHITRGLTEENFAPQSLGSDRI